MMRQQLTKTIDVLLFDTEARQSLLPFTYTRSIADIRVGILRIREKWEHYLGRPTGAFVTEEYLRGKYPVETESNANTLMIHASYLPNDALLDQIADLKIGEAIYNGKELLAFYAADQDFVNVSRYKKIQFRHTGIIIRNTWDIFLNNAAAIESDFELLTRNRKSMPLPDTNRIIGKHPIFIEEGATLHFVTLNTSQGPIYLGKDSEIMEGSLIRGPFALCSGATIKMGAKIYGGTTVGPFSKVGGELNNCVFFGYSNKSHDGFIGNSVIGSWCNLGADTNISNLKNNYASVRVWNYETENFVDTALQFCGLMMGDHSKCGINTMFNTGSLVGVSANIFGGDFPVNFIPSFSWGGAKGFTTYLLDKAIAVAKAVMGRRDQKLSAVDEEILKHIFNDSRSWRKS